MNIKCPKKYPKKQIQPPLYSLVYEENVPYGFAKGGIFVSIYEEIGETIIRLRKEKGLTQESFALECDISVSYLRLIEHGKANPTVNELWKIAEALDVELRNPFEVEVVAI